MRWRGRLGLGARLLLVPLLLSCTVPAAQAQMVNTATATGTPRGGTLAPAQDTESVDLVNRAPALTVAKSANVASVNNPGDVINYSVLVTNTGNTTLSAITVTDTLVTLTCPTSGSNTIATLAPGAGETCTASYTVTVADFDGNGGGDGDIDNTASATGSGAGGSGPASDSAAVAVTLNLNPSIDLVKAADDDTLVIAGQLITYTYTVTNNGNQTITNITVSDTHKGIPGALVPVFQSFTINNGNGIGSFSTNSGNTITVLYPGDQATYTATYTVTQDDVDFLQ
ncbi:MAG: hypothetical protein WBO55_16110 [Rhizobiaceae bacterium]